MFCLFLLFLSCISLLQLPIILWLHVQNITNCVCIDPNPVQVMKRRSLRVKRPIWYLWVALLWVAVITLCSMATWGSCYEVCERDGKERIGLCRETGDVERFPVGYWPVSFYRCYGICTTLPLSILFQRYTFYLYVALNYITACTSVL